MYATVEQANAYAQKYYSSTNPLRVAWMALTNEDKEVALNKAQQTIDQLPLLGQSVEAEVAFPRTPSVDTSLLRAQEATVELALRTLDEAAQERYQLQGQGVRSYKLGDLSETFGGNVGYSGYDAFAFSIVYPFLKTWLSGGYKICPTRTQR